MQLFINKLSEAAKAPGKSYKTDSGFDLYSAEDVVIQPGETITVKTDIALKLPEGHEAQVRPRSGITSKTKLRVQIGTIDNDYRGNIGVIVDNIHVISQAHYFSDHFILLNGQTEQTDRTLRGTYKIKKGDKIAQLVVAPVSHPEIVVVDDLDESARGSNGFGSTGY